MINSKPTSTNNKRDINSIYSIESKIDCCGNETTTFNGISQIVVNGDDEFSDSDDDMTVTTSGNSSCDVGRVDDCESLPKLVARSNNDDSSEDEDKVTQKQQGKKKKPKCRQAKKSLPNSRTNSTSNNATFGGYDNISEDDTIVATGKVCGSVGLDDDASSDDATTTSTSRGKEK